jgi:hypothetical protein
MECAAKRAKLWMYVILNIQADYFKIKFLASMKASDRVGFITKIVIFLD